MTIHQYTTKEEAASAMAQAINELLREVKKPVLFLTAEGSNFDVLAGVDTALLGLRATIGTTDERYSDDDSINNFARLMRLPFYQGAVSRGSQIIDTHVYPEESMEQFRARYEQELFDWREKNPDGVVITTVGMGPDGHMSGIMPFPDAAAEFTELFESNGSAVDATNGWITAYDATGKSPYPHRVTATCTFYREQVDYVFAFITGERKKPAMRTLQQKSLAVHEQPAQLLHELSNVQLFTTLVE